MTDLKGAPEGINSMERNKQVLRSLIANAENTDLDKDVRKKYRKASKGIFYNNTTYTENPRHQNVPDTGNPYIVHKFLSEKKNETRFYERFEPTSLSFEEPMTEEKCRLVQSAKILRDRVKLNDCKSYVIENVCRYKPVTDFFAKDFHRLLSHSALRRHFQAKVDFALWSDYLRNGNLQEIPLIV